jgi:ATP-binding cassette subfamily B (MDR/TAP) protein 1
MGDGLILESGTHEQLLTMNGAYSRLVQAQRLREGREQSALDSEDDDVDEPTDMEKAAREEIPLGRKNTRQSLASEILEQRRKAAETSGTKHDGDEDYGLFYLAKRMAPIIRDQWKNYLVGSFFACSM